MAPAEPPGTFRETAGNIQKILSWYTPCFSWYFASIPVPLVPECSLIVVEPEGYCLSTVAVQHWFPYVEYPY